MNASDFRKLASRLLLIVILLGVCSLANQCHYSCGNCTTPAYTSCLSCKDPTETLTVLQSPQLINPLYIHSIYQSGICTAKVPQYPNGLGIFLLIVSIIGLLITQSHQLFYICSALQTLALFSLLEVPWLEPASFILQSFQYFMPINIILQPSKIKDSNLFIYGFYRLDQYMISIEDIGLITIFIIDCVLFLFILILFIVTMFRRKKQQNQLQSDTGNRLDQNNGNNLVPEFSKGSQMDIEEMNKYKTKSKLQMGNQKIIFQNDTLRKQEEKPGCGRKLGRIICEKAAQCLILRKIMHIAIYVFYFFVQETAFSIMVGAVFDISTLDVAIWIVYFIQVITVLIISIYETEVDKQLNPEITVTHQFGLSLFLSRECLFIVLVKKIILPLGVVIPSQIQYIYFILYLVLFIIEGSMDSRSGRMACISRITLWKIFQMLTTTLILVFFFNSRSDNSTAQNLNPITIVLTVLLIVFIISFFIELVVSLVLIFIGGNQVQNINSSNKVQNQKNLTLNNTEMDLNQNNQKQSIVIFDMVPITRQNTKTPKNINKTNQFKKFQKQNLKTIEVEEFNENQEEVIPQKVVKDQLVINKSKNNKNQTNKQSQYQVKQQGSDNSTYQSKNKEESSKQVQATQNKNKTQQNNKKKRIQDPQLRKRYGIK